jgi:hypothetical protein
MSATVCAIPGRVATFGQFNELWRDANRTPRRQRLVKHLIECGERPVLEALVAVARGDDLDETLEDFARLHPKTYRDVGADTLPIDKVRIIKGN